MNIGYAAGSYDPLFLEYRIISVSSFDCGAQYWTEINLSSKHQKIRV